MGGLFPILIVLSVVGTALLPYCWWRWKTRRSSHWPVVPATIHSAGVQVLERQNTPDSFRIVFGYSYLAKGQPETGFFAVTTSDQALLNTLEAEFEGMKVDVRYHPDRPHLSVLVESALHGLAVQQDSFATRSVPGTLELKLNPPARLSSVWPTRREPR